MIDDAQDRLLDRFAEPAPLGGKVDEGHRFRRHQEISSSVLSSRLHGSAVPVLGQTRSGRAVLRSWLIQPMRSRRHAGHQRVGRHVLRDHRAGRDEAYSPSVWPQTIVALAPIVAPRLTSVGRNSDFALDLGARVVDVGEDAGRAAEHAVLEGHALIDRDIVLDLARCRRHVTLGPITTFWPILTFRPSVTLPQDDG